MKVFTKCGLVPADGKDQRLKHNHTKIQQHRRTSSETPETYKQIQENTRKDKKDLVYIDETGIASDLVERYVWEKKAR